jgi:RimJ/RimL family protein N-acetyltransferase
MKTNPVYPKITFTPLDEPTAIEIVSWRYDPPYDIYNIEDLDAAILYAIDPQNRFFAMRDATDKLVGFCSFGQDGQVPGGNYDLEALDIGMGIHPDLTGLGHGTGYVAAVLNFAREEFAMELMRVTIAAFNLRAQRVWEKNGFRPVQAFKRALDDRDFVVLLRDEGASSNFNE